MRTSVLVIVLGISVAAEANVVVQGALTSNAGAPAPDGTYGVVFSIWDAQQDGTMLWEEIHTAETAVAVVDGAFSAELGKVAPVVPSLFQGGARWLEVQVVPDPALPRRRIDPVPLALTAQSLECSGCVAMSALSFVPALAADLAAMSSALDAHIADQEAHGPKYSDAQAVAAVEAAAALSLTGKVNFNQKPVAGLRFETAEADPVDCVADTAGYVYFNTAKKQVLVCDGAAFVSLVNEPLGTANNPGKSCNAVLQAGDSKGDGVYWLAPDGVAAQFYCDMTTDGGGWTKIESAAWPDLFSNANWESHNADAPLSSMYSAVGLRSAFMDGAGCATWRVRVGNAGDWTGAVAHHTVWTQCHDPFTDTTNGSDYTFVSGEAPVTCGGFNGLHHKYQGYSFTSDVDTGDSSGCWYMQIVPHTQHGGTVGYLDGYGGQYYGRKWQSLWMR